MATNKVGSLVLVPKLMAWVEDVGRTPWLQLGMSNSVELHLFAGRKHVVSYTHTHTLSLSLIDVLTKGYCPMPFIYTKKNQSWKAHTIANLWLGQKKLLYIHENNTHFHFKKRKKQKGRLHNRIKLVL